MQLSQEVQNKLRTVVGAINEGIAPKNPTVDRILKTISKNKLKVSKDRFKDGRYPTYTWEIDSYGVVKFFPEGNGHFKGEVLMWTDGGQRTVAMDGRVDAVFKAFEKSLKKSGKAE